MEIPECQGTGDTERAAPRRHLEFETYITTLESTLRSELKIGNRESDFEDYQTIRYKRCKALSLLLSSLLGCLPGRVLFPELYFAYLAEWSDPRLWRRRLLVWFGGIQQRGFDPFLVLRREFQAIRGKVENVYRRMTLGLNQCDFDITFLARKARADAM
jgi:hypothetical protein